MKIRDEQGRWAKLTEHQTILTEKLLNKALAKKRWENLKADGNAHYHTGGTEPVDLYRAGGMFRDWALASIIKYAFRCRREFGREPAMVVQDMRKITDLANKMIASFEVEE